MRVKINLSLDQETADALRDLANASHITMSQLVTNWIWQHSAQPTIPMQQTPPATTKNTGPVSFFRYDADGKMY